MSKLPRIEGLSEVRERLKESSRKAPTAELIDIVEETLIEAEKDENKKHRKPEKAAKDLTTATEADT